MPDSATVSAPVYVEYPGGVEEEDSVPPPPTSPVLEAEGAATGASGSGHVQIGHSPSGPSRPPRVRGARGGKKNQTNRLIKKWQTDFDCVADFLWTEAEFWLRYVQYEDASATNLDHSSFPSLVESLNNKSDFGALRKRFCPI